MNFIFTYTGAPNPIIETQLELIKKHDLKNNRILILRCIGELPNCHWNPYKIKAKCMVCKSRFDNGLKIAKFSSRVNVLNFNNYIPKNPIKNFKKINEMQSLLNFRYKNYKIGYGVASSVISILRTHKFNYKYNKNLIQRFTNTSCALIDAISYHVNELNADAIFFFNGRISSELPAMLVAKNKNIDFYSYEVAFKSNYYRLLKNNSVHLIRPSKKTFLKTKKNWSASKSIETNNFFYSRKYGKAFENIINFLDHSQLKKELPFEINKRITNIAIFNSTVDEYAAVEHYPHKIYLDETIGVYKILDSFKGDPQFMFYLRVHPHMKNLDKTTAQLAQIKIIENSFKNVKVIWPSDKVNSYSLIAQCDKVITFGSTIGAEATFWGRPSILAGSAFYENFDVTYNPTSHRELISLVKKELTPKPKINSQYYASWELNFGEPFKWFKQKGIRNNLAYGEFDGKEIKSDKIFYFYYMFIKIPFFLLFKLKKILFFFIGGKFHDI